MERNASANNLHWVGYGGPIACSTQRSDMQFADRRRD
jgi:hypothetical protein